MSDQLSLSGQQYPKPWMEVNQDQPRLVRLLFNQEEFKFTDDANENDQQIDDDKSRANFAQSIKEAAQTFDLFVENRLDECLSLCEAKASNSIYHRYGIGVMIGVNAFFSMEPNVINHAINELSKIVDFLDKRKDKSGGLFSNPNYQEITDEQAHAALCFTELNAMLAFLKPMADKSFKGFLSSAFRLKSSYTGFKGCLAMYRKKPFQDELSCEEFQTGVRMIYGIFGLFFSLLPAKFTSLLEYFGLFNNRYAGLDILKKCITCKHTLRYSVSSAFIIAYFAFLDYFFSLGESDLNMVDTIVTDWGIKYGKTYYYYLIKGMGAMTHSQFEEACTTLTQSFTLPAISPNLYKMSYFFMALSKIQLCQWSEAANMMKILAGDKISPATTTYFYAILLYMEYDLNGEKKHANQIIDLMKIIPSLKKTLGGRKPFHEKLVYERSIKFNGNSMDKSLFLPTFEISYIWNLFRMSRSSTSCLNRYMDIVDAKLSEYNLNGEDNNQSNQKAHDNPDQYATLIFYKAHLTDLLGNPYEAIDYYHQVLEWDSKLTTEKHIIPQSYYELGYLFRKIERYEDCEKYLTKSKLYRGYLTESMITYRVNLVFEQVKKITKVKRKLSSPYDRRKSSIIDPSMFNRPVSYS
ncbi:tetratricopeptide repeat protein 39A-like [Panonychus citri]|uniref:tetratricopeptide repeat protein 39A-like n=1 Tax=Panonychus citri TaxID=50023 RepID=UPI0023078A6A|nr:tetratricopeptide repeat protein 39A-like [Panonychus citri]XP_053206357.1 tetratricopeptide repeat protein 39A-like [Panonychus citri]